MKSNHLLFVSVLMVGNAFAWVPDGKQECFVEEVYKPMVVFADVTKKKTVWVGLTGDLTEPYDYRSLKVEERKPGNCDFCFTLKSHYEKDGKTIEVKIVTSEASGTGAFDADVFWKYVSEKRWHNWVTGLSCRSS